MPQRNNRKKAPTARRGGWGHRVGRPGAGDDGKGTQRDDESIAVVAEGLRNTPAVARSSYIDPLVLERYRRGTTAALSRGRVSDAALAELLG